MPRKRAGRIAASGALVAIVWLATVVGAVAMAVGAMASFGMSIIVVIALDAAAFASVGALIVRRQPDNRIGWLLLAAGPAIVLTFSGFVFGGIRFVEAGATDPLAMGLAWLGNTAFYLTFVLFALIGLFFPDGHLPSRRWRPIVRALVVLVGICGVVVAFGPGPIGEDLADNPFAIDDPIMATASAAAGGLATLGILLLIGLAALAVAVRFRRSRGATRLQLKWFLASVAAFAILLPVSFIDTLFVAEDDFTVFDLLAIASLALIPLSIGVAVLRYRLYAIDRILSRTVAWTVVTAVLGGMFVLLILAFQAASSGLTESDTLAVAASTLIVASLFQPFRRRIQEAVDRRFDRAHYDATRVADGFAGSLRNQLDMDALQSEIRRVAAETVRPTSAGIWLRAPAAERGQGRSER